VATKNDVVAFLSWLSTPSVEENGNGKLSQEQIDQRVWQEEEASGAFNGHIPDIRDPKVRAEVRRIAAEQERRLEERLIAAGLHVLQRKVSDES
jgi:hypothetical protein